MELVVPSLDRLDAYADALRRGGYFPDNIRREVSAREELDRIAADPAAFVASLDDREGKGALIYLRQEGRGIGLANKLHAYALQDQGLDTVEANVQLGLPVDKRDYGIGSQILRDLGLRKIRILTNNPKKIVGLEGYGLRVTDQLPIQHPATEHNRDYLRAKRDRLGHLLHHQGLALDEEMIHEERVQDRARERRAQRDPERQREPRG